MSRILLDTHVFLWWAFADSRVRPAWVEAIAAPENTVFVSAVTAWEVETKKRVGKMVFPDDVATVAAGFGFEHLFITMAHATMAGSLDWDHRDPFDRMLVAQAMINDMTLLTSDDAMRSAPGVRVL